MNHDEGEGGWIIPGRPLTEWTTWALRQRRSTLLAVLSHPGGRRVRGQLRDIEAELSRRGEVMV